MNRALEGDPSLVNRDAFGEGWLYKVKIANVAEKDALLGPAEYETLVAEGAH